MDKKKYTIISALLILAVIILGVIYFANNNNGTNEVEANPDEGQELPIDQEPVVPATASFIDNKLVVNGKEVTLSQWEKGNLSNRVNVLANDSKVACLDILTEDSVAVFRTCVDLISSQPLWEYSYSGDEGQYDYEYQVSGNIFTEVATHLNGDIHTTNYILRVNEAVIDFPESFNKLVSSLSLTKPIVIDTGNSTRIVDQDLESTVIYDLTLEKSEWKVSSKTTYKVCNGVSTRLESDATCK